MIKGRKNVLRISFSKLWSKFDSDILRINDYINDEYKITHKPVENYKLLLYSFELTNGNIDDALSLVNRYYYKIKVRAPGDFGDLKTNIDEFKLKVLDEFLKIYRGILLEKIIPHLHIRE